MTSNMMIMMLMIFDDDDADANADDFVPRWNAVCMWHMWWRLQEWVQDARPPQQAHGGAALQVQLVRRRLQLQSGTQDSLPQTHRRGATQVSHTVLFVYYACFYIWAAATAQRRMDWRRVVGGLSLPIITLPPPFALLKLFLFFFSY